MNKSIIDYVATYIDKLDVMHPVNVAFGQKLRFFPRSNDPNNNIFKFSFPLTQENNQLTNIMSDTINLSTLNRNGICIAPMAGSMPEAFSGQTYPNFVIYCAHLDSEGIAFNTALELIYELQENSRVFPQNGGVRAIYSQPANHWTTTTGYCCYKAFFKCLVAERIT